MRVKQKRERLMAAADNGATHDQIWVRDGQEKVTTLTTNIVGQQSKTVEKEAVCVCVYSSLLLLLL